MEDQPVSAALEDANAEEDVRLHPLVALIENQFDESATDRRTQEQLWVEAYQNFRGHYAKNYRFTDSERSQAFVKITKTKVLAAYGQILEVMFGNGKLPISIEPTPKPNNVEEVAHIDLADPIAQAEQAAAEEAMNNPYGFEGDDNAPEANATLTDRIGAVFKKAFEGFKVQKGDGTTAEHITIRPADKAAEKMQKTIDDQLEEADAVQHIMKAIFEAVLQGTGVIKGPFLKQKEYPRWLEDGTYDPIYKIVPDIEFVSIWDYYPDASCLDSGDNETHIQVRKLTKSQLRRLKRDPFFRESAIDEAILRGAGYAREWWEDELDTSDDNASESSDRFRVLEYWGVVDTDFIIDELEEDLPEALEDKEELMVNVWVCNGMILRAVLNPFKPSRAPYHVFHYEEDIYNFFGVGVAENMRDSQTLMNGFTRMAVDNAVLAGNMMVEVDESNLAPGQDLTLEPGKVWRRMGGAPGQAVFGIKFPSTANENMMMFDKFRQLADDATGIPSFSHGQTGVSGTGRTASGISMLMGAANLNTKTAVKNIDRMLRSLGEALYAFNMQFNPDPEIVGDLEVKASGTSSLIAKEVYTQKLMQVLQLAQNPALAPFADLEAIWKETVKALDLDEEKLTLDPKRAAAQAARMAAAQREMNPQGQPPQAQGQGGAPQPPNAAGMMNTMQAPNGAGNIAPADPTVQLEQQMQQGQM